MQGGAHIIVRRSVVIPTQGTMSVLATLYYFTYIIYSLLQVDKAIYRYLYNVATKPPSVILLWTEGEPFTQI